MEIINGFQCKNCTDVDYAKKHIDPAHPKDGPYGVNAKNDPSRAAQLDRADPSRDPAVVFGGALSPLNRIDGANGAGASDGADGPPSQSQGAFLNLSV